MNWCEMYLVSSIVFAVVTEIEKKCAYAYSLKSDIIILIKFCLIFVYCSNQHSCFWIMQIINKNCRLKNAGQQYFNYLFWLEIMTT